MLASRRQSNRAKSRHGKRAASTLKHSSNQKGFFARKSNRRVVAAKANKARENTETRVQDGCCGGVVGDGVRIPDDTMLIITREFGGFCNMSVASFQASPRSSA